MSRRPTFQASFPAGSSPEGLRSPINSAISYPQVLDPEHGPQTVHRSDLFFINSNPPHTNARQNAEYSRRPSDSTTRPPSSELYPYHQQGFHRYSPASPVFHGRQDTNPQYQPPPPTYLQHPTYGAIYGSSAPPAPPLPPKPIVYPTIATGPNYGQYAAPLQPPSLPSTPQPLSPAQEEEETVMSPTEDPNELAMAIALSQSESIERQKLQEDLRNQEEEDLAKALAESLLSTGSHVNESVNPFFLPVEESIAPSPQPEEHTSALPTSAARAAVDLPSHDTPTPTHPANTPPHLSYPEFGRHEKWRLPGMSDNGSEASHNSDDKPSNLDKNASFKFPPTELPRDDPPAEVFSRSSSISSVTSLAYMQADPGEDGKDVDYQLRDGNQDGRDDPSDTHISNFEDISPSVWTSGQVNDAFVEPEEANVLEFDDEAYARQLAAEEEALAAQSQYQYPNEKAFPMPQSGQDYGPPHQYMAEDQQNSFYSGSSSSTQLYKTRRPTFSSDSTSSSAPISTAPSITHSPPVTYSPYTTPQLPEYGLPASINHFQKRPSISYINNGPMNAPFSPVVYPTLGNRHESEFDNISESSHHSSTHSTASAPPAFQSGSPTSPAPSLSQYRPSGAAAAVIPGSAPVIPAAALVPGAGLRNANHFVDTELLVGVSIGFKPPAVTAKLVPMQDPMPNIISLPYTKCPPLHLQAPDWRHLLRLMARLSGTRIEPTVEAMAVSKTDLKLRTVVQFIKPHQHSNEWRTILWFTIDHPVPPTMPGAARYSYGNPNMLPWSYMLSPLPMLLRDAADTHISKTYTIPATDSVPLPVLPITFPSLALYLQAALDASRMHSSDNATGLGKLGKLVQMCYPSVEQTYSEFDIPERSRMSDMFKRVIKRSNKDKKKGKTTNNEETYQLVTPFVPDEWG